MNPENEEAKPKVIKRTKKDRAAYEAFKHRLGIPFLKLGYRVDFKTETKDKIEFVIARLVDKRIGLWALAETPMPIIVNKKSAEIALKGTTQTLWERMGEGLRGMRHDQKCWLRMKARRDRRRKELKDGEEEGRQEDGGARIVNLDAAKAKARAAGLHVP